MFLITQEQHVPFTEISVSSVPGLDCVSIGAFTGSSPSAADWTCYSSECSTNWFSTNLSVAPSTPMFPPKPVCRPEPPCHPEPLCNTSEFATGSNKEIAMKKACAEQCRDQERAWDEKCRDQDRAWRETCQEIENKYCEALMEERRQKAEIQEYLSKGPYQGRLAGRCSVHCRYGNASLIMNAHTWTTPASSLPTETLVIVGFGWSASWPYLVRPTTEDYARQQHSGPT